MRASERVWWLCSSYNPTVVIPAIRTSKHAIRAIRVTATKTPARARRTGRRRDIAPHPPSNLSKTFRPFFLRCYAGALRGFGRGPMSLKPSQAAGLDIDLWPHRCHVLAPKQAKKTSGIRNVLDFVHRRRRSGAGSKDSYPDATTDPSEATTI